MRVPLAAALVLLAVIPAGGHHAFSTYYFEERSVTIEGEVVQFDLRAPHAWVYVMAPDADGRLQRFGAEWGNPRRLSRDGITSDTLKPGDRVVITGSPGRNPAEYKVHLKRIERPADGWRWRNGVRTRPR